jgi:hypothetical protein
MTFFGSKTTIYQSLGHHKGIQVIEQAFSPQKRTSSTFLISLTFALLDPDPENRSGSGPTGLIEVQE